jgi:hypothetical protein
VTSAYPLLVLVIYGALRSRGIEPPNLSTLVSTYSSTIGVATACSLEQELALVCVLLRGAGIELSDQKSGSVSLPAGLDLVAASREATLEVCRWIMVTTACGRRTLDYTELTSLLPQLCVSYARVCDLGAVCGLLRACCYALVTDSPAFRWALDWMLDQQYNDGRFGHVSEDAHNLAGHEQWKPFFLPTVETLWSLAEIHRPGFLFTYA